jgi:hypothetical protein
MPSNALCQVLSFAMLHSGPDRAALQKPACRMPRLKPGSDRTLPLNLADPSRPSGRQAFAFPEALEFTDYAYEACQPYAPA